MKAINSILIPAVALALLAGCSKGGDYFDFPASANYEAVYDDGQQPIDPAFEGIVENPFIKVADEPVSTFSTDADGASYSYARRCLLGGYPYWLEVSAIRTEEFLNYFTFDYSEPTGDETLGINAEIGPCPWAEGHKLLRLGLKGKSLGEDEIPPANYIFLIDTSGSMLGDDRLELIKSGLVKLVDHLRPTDRVAIITYSGSVSLLLESTLAKDAARIKSAIRKLSASGGTAGGPAMEMAYKEAAEHYMTGGNNRIIMCTDGDFNVGVSSTDALVEMVESYQSKGIYLSIMGFGVGNFQDSRMENLAAHGNGTYNYIDSEAEMMKVFVYERSRFWAVANDTKCQITFSDAIESYRLIGYEHRVMNNEDFEDDSKDAGEIGAGQTVTALYELIPSESYNVSEGAATFDVRYKKALGGSSRPLQLEIKVPSASEHNTPEFNFASGVAAFALTLRNSQYRGNATYSLASDLVRQGIGQAPDPLGLRSQLLEVIDAAEKMASSKSNQ